MSFAREQVERLQRPLDRRFVRERKHAGVTLSYIEGWKAIEYANDVFGFDGWDRETVFTTCVHSGEREGGRAKHFCAYIARVRVTVRADGTTVAREGTGYGSGFGTNPGEAHESAIKEAETDAMKRALMTFGWGFGLALYDKEQEHVIDVPEEPMSEEEAKAHIEEATAGVRAGERAGRDPQQELAEWADRALRGDVQKRLSLQQRKAVSRSRALALSKIEEIYREMGEAFDARAWTARFVGVPVAQLPEHLSPIENGITDKQLKELEQEAKAFLARVKARAAEAAKNREG